MDKHWPSAHIKFKWVDVHWCVQHEFPCLLLPPIAFPAQVLVVRTCTRHVHMYPMCPITCLMCMYVRAHCLCWAMNVCMYVCTSVPSTSLPEASGCGQHPELVWSA